MSDASTTGPMRAADGTLLKVSLARALRRQKLRALMLIMPLLAFVLIGFVLPIGQMLMRSVENDIVQDTLPLTIEALQEWDSTSNESPPEAVFTALAIDLQAALESKSHTILGRRLNFEYSGITTLFRKAGRDVEDWNVETDGPFRVRFEEIDEEWIDPTMWRAILAYSGRYTAGYYLAAIDKTMVSGQIENRPENESLHLMLFGRTAWVSILICFCTLLLGYPIAFLLSNLKARHSNLLLILVLLPFWTSLLVRTSAWKVLLQEQGVINDIMVGIGILADDNRFQMINNKLGVVIAMTHILLPFMILPLYSVMKTIPPTYVRAAKSLGATDWTAFWRVYFPQSIPGIGAGAILVFILSVGYYITPELVGGPTGSFISNRIAYQWSGAGNWGLVGALGAILLVAVLILYWVYDKIVGIDNVKLG